MARFLGIALGLMLAASWARAAPGGDSPPAGGGDTTPRRIQADVSGDLATPQRGQMPAVDVEGRVVDASGRPLGGVLVKAFADGLISGSATSDTDGSFRLAATLVETSGKGSAVLWFDSPRDEHLDALVVLWTGDAAKAAGVFPPCTQILPVHGGRTIGKVEVTMRTADERRKAVAASECLEGAAEPGSPR